MTQDQSCGPLSCWQVSLLCAGKEGNSAALSSTTATTKALWSQKPPGGPLGRILGADSSTSLLLFWPSPEKGNTRHSVPEINDFFFPLSSLSSCKMEIFTSYEIIYPWVLHRVGSNFIPTSLRPTTDTKWHGSMPRWALSHSVLHLTANCL